MSCGRGYHKLTQPASHRTTAARARGAECIKLRFEMELGTAYCRTVRDEHALLEHPTMKQIDAPLSPDQARRELRAATQRMGERRLPSDWPKFVDYAWSKFKPRTVSELLLADEPSYDGHKAILFTGLCIWAVCPCGHDELRQHGMLLTGIGQLRRAEELGQRATLKSGSMMSGMLGQLSAISPDFYSDFYYPIGGSSNGLSWTDPNNFHEKLERLSSEILTTVGMMQIYDFYAKNLFGDNRYGDPSLKRGYILTNSVIKKRMQEGGVGEDEAKDRWSVTYPSAALSYSASTIYVDGSKTLLDVIRFGEARYDMLSHLLPQWLARARYAADTIMRGFKEPRAAEENRANLPDILPEPTPDPSFSEEERAVITAAFDRKRINMERGYTPPLPRKVRKLT